MRAAGLFVALLGATTGCGKTAPPAAASAQATASASAGAEPSSSAADSRDDAATPRLHVAVDRRVELFSILFRTAKNPSYMRAKGAYADEVDAHFGPFAEHAAVKDTIELRSEHGISFDAPMRLAVYLDDALAPIAPLAPLPPGLDDPRFEGVDLPSYLSDVRAFAEATDFDTFFTLHATYYARIEGRMRGFLADKPVIPWFDGVFGEQKNAEYDLAPAPLVWPMNYGVHAVRPDGTVEIVETMFLEKPAPNGDYAPGDTTLELVAHEMAHSYVNEIVDRADAELGAAEKAIFDAGETKMRAQAYTTPRVAMQESIVRALVITFLRDRGDDAHAARTLQEEEGRGFAWMAPLVASIEAARKAKGGKLDPETLVAATRAALDHWPAH